MPGAYLGPFQTSMMEVFYDSQKGSIIDFDKVRNAPMIVAKKKKNQNLSSEAEAYLKPCQTSMMERFYEKS